MAKDHGFDGIVKVNTTHEVGHLQSWSIDDGVSLTKGSAMRQSWEDARAFARKWSGSGEAYFDAADLGENAMALGTQVTLHLYPGGDDQGKNVRSGTASMTSVTQSAPKDGWVTVTFGFEGEGELVSESGGDPNAHLMWAVLCEEVQNSGYYAIAELEFRLEAAGADISTPGAAIAGADRDAGKTADTAFDDDGVSYWQCRISDGANAWVGQQFGMPRRVLEIAITARTDSVNFDQTPRDFSVIYSDNGGVDWTVALQVVGEANWSSGEQRVYAVP